uniref:hypothetical protein n=1 Tax=Agathobacter sp. TaxID=2021311 RepID=UPI004056D87C
MSVIPNVKKKELKKSRAVVGDQRLRDTFANNTQTGTVYAVIPYFGRLSGTSQNYDGVGNLTPESTTTYEQGVFTYGRMMGWTEADFSYDVTGGTDFMANVREQINEYWDGQDRDTLLAILAGVFGMPVTVVEGTDDAEGYSAYTTYILGEGAIGFEPVGAKVPYEMVRDAKTRGGEDTLISRKRNAVSVAGISYLKAKQATNSPTNTELANGLNWSLVTDDNNKTIPHKATISFFAGKFYNASVSVG